MCGGLKAVGINVMISHPAAGRDAPQSMSTTAADGKHMLHLGSVAAPACANGHVRRLMRASSPKTRIQRTYLQQRRWEPSDYFHDLCGDAGINKGCTHTCTPTHKRTHARGASLLETFVAFFMIPPLQRKLFSISSEPTLKEASGFSSNDKSNLIKGGKIPLAGCCMACLHGCMVPNISLTLFWLHCVEPLW